MALAAAAAVAVVLTQLPLIAPLRSVFDQRCEMNFTGKVKLTGLATVYDYLMFPVRVCTI